MNIINDRIQSEKEIINYTNKYTRYTLRTWKQKRILLVNEIQFEVLKAYNKRINTSLNVQLLDDRINNNSYYKIERFFRGVKII